MSDLKDKMAEAARLEAEILAEARASAAAVVAEVRGKGGPLFTAVKFSEIEDSDWSAERYVPEAQAAALEAALDRPTAAGLVSAARKIMAERRVTRGGASIATGEHRVNLSRRTMALLERSALGECAKAARPAGEDPGAACAQ